VNAEQAPIGGALFANLGCISCHSTPMRKVKIPHKRVPLAHLKAKWKPVRSARISQGSREELSLDAHAELQAHERGSRASHAYLLSGKQRGISGCAGWRRNSRRAAPRYGKLP
jgi:hypothetical protein